MTHMDYQLFSLQHVQEAFQISCSYKVLMAQAQAKSRKYELGQELVSKEKAQIMLEQERIRLQGSQVAAEISVGSRKS